jgi:hypothetical protein
MVYVCCRDLGAFALFGPALKPPTLSCAVPAQFPSPRTGQEEESDLDHLTEYSQRDCPLYRLTNSDRQGRYRLVKPILTDPRFKISSQDSPNLGY